MDEQYLSVTSGLEETFSAKFHGEEYVFEYGEPVNMPMDAVRHIFGFGLDDKTRAFHRLGWLTLVSDLKVAKEKLKLIQFERVRKVFELQRARSEKASNDRSPVKAGGDGEASSEASTTSTADGGGQTK